MAFIRRICECTTGSRIFIRVIFFPNEHAQTWYRLYCVYIQWHLFGENANTLGEDADTPRSFMKFIRVISLRRNVHIDYTWTFSCVFIFKFRIIVYILLTVRFFFQRSRNVRHLFKVKVSKHARRYNKHELSKMK